MSLLSKVEKVKVGWAQQSSTFSKLLEAWISFSDFFQKFYFEFRNFFRIYELLDGNFRKCGPFSFHFFGCNMDFLLNFPSNFRIFFWIYKLLNFFWISELSSKFQNLVSQFLRFPKFPNFKTKFPNFQQNLVATWFLPNFYRFFSQNFLPIFLPDFLISFFLIVLHCPPIFYGSFINFFQTFPWNLISEFFDQIW